MPFTLQRHGLLAAVLACSLACGQNSRSLTQATHPESAREAPAQAAPPPPGGGAAASSTTEPVAREPQKRIRTGTLSLEVASVAKAATALGQIARSAGGYVADTQSTRHAESYYTGRVVLRLPAEAYDTASRSMHDLGKVLSEQSSLIDVTKAYTDLETRLKVKREALARIRDLMARHTGSLKDVLEAEQEIARITEEIELAEGERRLLDHQIQLSTLIVELREPEPMDLGRPGAWSPLGEVFRNATSMLAESLAVLVGFLLIALPWVAAGYGGFRLVRWMLRRRKAKKAEQAP